MKRHTAEPARSVTASISGRSNAAVSSRPMAFQQQKRKQEAPTTISAVSPTTAARHLVYGRQRKMRFINPVSVMDIVATAEHSVADITPSFASIRRTSTGTNSAIALGIALHMTLERNDPSMRLLFGSRARRNAAMPIIKVSSRNRLFGWRG